MGTRVYILSSRVNSSEIERGGRRAASVFILHAYRLDKCTKSEKRPLKNLRAAYPPIHLTSICCFRQRPVFPVVERRTHANPAQRRYVSFSFFFAL